MNCIFDGRKSEEGNLSENGGKSEVEESADGAGDDRSGDRREGEEAGEGAEEEDEAGVPRHVEQVRRPRDPACKLQSSNFLTTIWRCNKKLIYPP